MKYKTNWIFLQGHLLTITVESKQTSDTVAKIISLDSHILYCKVKESLFILNEFNNTFSATYFM